MGSMQTLSRRSSLCMHRAGIGGVSWSTYSGVIVGKDIMSSLYHYGRAYFYNRSQDMSDFGIGREGFVKSQLLVETVSMRCECKDRRRT